MKTQELILRLLSVDNLETTCPPEYLELSQDEIKKAIDYIDIKIKEYENLCRCTKDPDEFYDHYSSIRELIKRRKWLIYLQKD